MAVLATIVGLVGGFGAIGFRYLIEAVQTLAYGAKGNLLELLLSAPWYYKVWVPALGGLVVGPLVYFFAREAKGHGAGSDGGRCTSKRDHQKTCSFRKISRLGHKHRDGRSRG